jgi:hypothetical protein
MRSHKQSLRNLPSVNLLTLWSLWHASYFLRTHVVDDSANLNTSSQARRRVMNAALKMLGVSFITFTQLVVTADLRADDCRSTFRAVRHPYRSSFRFNDRHDSFRSNNDRRQVSNSCNSSRRDNSRRLPLQRENSVQFAPSERRFSDSPTTRNRETQPSARENISTRPVGGNGRTTQSVDAQPVGGNRQATQSARLSLESQRRPPQAQPRGFTNQPNESVVPKSPTAISWFHDLDDAFRKNR